MDYASILKIIVIILGCNGFWELIKVKLINKHKSCEDLEIDVTVLNSASRALLHDRLTYACVKYIKAKEINHDEMDNLNYMYKAYVALGGNGTVKRLYEEVLKLPIV